MSGKSRKSQAQLAKEVGLIGNTVWHAFLCTDGVCSTSTHHLGRSRYKRLSQKQKLVRLWCAVCVALSMCMVSTDLFFVLILSASVFLQTDSVVFFSIVPYFSTHTSTCTSTHISHFPGYPPPPSPKQTFSQPPLTWFPVIRFPHNLAKNYREGRCSVQLRYSGSSTYPDILGQCRRVQFTEG